MDKLIERLKREVGLAFFYVVAINQIFPLIGFKDTKLIFITSRDNENNFL